MAHCGRSFDAPFLFHHVEKFGITKHRELMQKLYLLDTHDLTTKTIRSPRWGDAIIPTNFQLGVLYQYVTNDTHDAHRALPDVRATIAVLRYHRFWEKRIKFIYKLNENGTVILTNNLAPPILLPNDDSDTDDDVEEQWNQEPLGNDDDINEPEENIEHMPNTGWHPNTHFEGINADQFFRDNLETAEGHTGSINSVNSPIKAWRRVFTQQILNGIVANTNEYGNLLCPNWNNIVSKDLTDFISILFIAGIQRRRDCHRNWWSNNVLLEIPVVKRIMSGRKFQRIMRYLHVLSIVNQPHMNSPEYSPLYKVQELMDQLIGRFKQLFVPGQALSLDESLIRAFGRIKFKVRIMSKSARYGIKLYVVTDAVTAYILDVIVYIGSDTYDANDTETKKTVQVVKTLLSSFEGSHRTVYVDRFYTSVDLVKALDKMNLYVTGTVMRNRLPRALVVAKNSAEYKAMERGDSRTHKMSYMAEDGTRKECGLVMWKDGQPVYCLTSCDDTRPVDLAERQTRGIQRIQLTRPRVISNYNRFMGGVDLADKRRMHSSSAVMGKNRWWLKVFFYLLDAGTANALVLYNEAMLSMGRPTMNSVEFKDSIVKSLIGAERLGIDDFDAPSDGEPQHVPLRYEGDRRFSCAYCAAILQNSYVRTRRYCSVCNIPLCVPGNGRNENNCFNLFHRDQTAQQRQEQQQTRARHAIMLARSNHAPHQHQIEDDDDLLGDLGIDNIDEEGEGDNANGVEEV